jgi:hypothetical protein
MGTEMRLNMKSCPTLCAVMLALAAPARADFPIEDMGPRSLGIQYGLAFRGQNITSAIVPSHETLHLLSLAYAPVPYASIQAGIGIDAFDVETRNSVGFQGDFGISPAVGLVLATPYFAMDFLKGTGGIRALFLNSRNDQGYRYSAVVSNPFLGLVFSPSGYFDAEAGVRAHLMDGTMRGPGKVEQSFANDDIGRGYVTLTVKSPMDGAFLSVDLDMSPSIDADWTNGPQEAQVGISFGAILGGKAKPAKVKESPGYFPAYQEMKDKQDKMSEEIE